MPIYEYKCAKCGHLFEYLADNISDQAAKCPKCGAKKPVRQLSLFSAAEGARSGGGCSSGSCPTGSCSTGSCPF
jgi:putative FmdB family regulatory protein